MFGENDEMLVMLKLLRLLQCLLVLLLLYKSSDFRIYVFTSCRLISLTKSSDYRKKKMPHNERRSVCSGLRNMTLKHRINVP